MKTFGITVNKRYIALDARIQLQDILSQLKNLNVSSGDLVTVFVNEDIWSLPQYSPISERSFLSKKVPLQHTIQETVKDLVKKGVFATLLII